MRNPIMIACFGCLVATSAAAGPKRDPPMQLEVGFNTRHFAAAEAGDDVAFRSADPEMDAALGEGTAMTASLRFTGNAHHNTFFGVEAETGKLVGVDTSNIAGAYGVAGIRHDLGRLRIGAELVAGRRWVRYRLIGKEDDSLMIAEPRVRGDIWLSQHWTFGGAVGATIGDRSVWMAGVYFGLHAFPFDRRPRD
ncbi:MAG TPA: hypothetical protein VIV11_09130 [Kofleriaceae bacterium]